jgi:hypothetical protein
MRHLILTGLVAAFVLESPTTQAARPYEIESALTIAKSTNKNQVHYAVQVDDACAPAGAAPVHPYWRMLEKSPDATEPLERSEERAFGIERQEVVDRDDVRIALRALPARAITIRTGRANDGTCSAIARMSINGVNARVASVFVKMKLFGVDYVQLTGVADDGSVVKERLSI